MHTIKSDAVHNGVIYVDKTHTIEFFKSQAFPGRTCYAPTFRAFNGTNYYQKYYTLHGDVVNFYNLQSARNFIKRSTERKYKRKSLDILNILKRK